MQVEYHVINVCAFVYSQCDYGEYTKIFWPVHKKFDSNVMFCVCTLTPAPSFFPVCVCVCTSKFYL